MKFLAGLVVGALIVGGWLIYLHSNEDEQSIYFPRYQFMQLSDYVRVDGSLYGEGEGKPVNNFYSIECERQVMQCEVHSIQQIGEDLVGGFWEETIPISRWSDEEIIASSKELAHQSTACNFYEIRMDLTRDTATYVRRPREGANADCAARVEEKVMRWRFDNGPAWPDNADGSERR